MAKQVEHRKAIELRKSGKSYREIRQLLGVSKGTLSAWLAEYPLSEKRIRELRDWNQQRIEKYRETRRKNREAILATIYEKERRTVLPLSGRDTLIGGLFLYWGEGGKTSMSELSLSNTNPAIVKACMSWLEKTMGVAKTTIKIKLHLYTDMDIEKETHFWAKELKLSRRQFGKPYIKKSKFSELSYKNGFGHGTCNVLVRNAILAKKVMMGLKVLENFYADQ